MIRIVMGICLAVIISLSVPIAAMDKVALLFLTRQDLNHSDLWQKLLEENPEYFSIYIHSKEPLSSPFFAQYRIQNILPASWAYHVRPWYELVKEAVKNPENKKFVFLSESCVPIKPLSHIYETLCGTNRSYLWIFRGWWPEGDVREVGEIPVEYRWRSHEWVILNREHAVLMAKDTWIIDAVARHWGDAEAYPAHLLAYHGELFGPNVQICPTTYTDWSEGNASPHTFFEANDPALLRLIETRKKDSILFARKFATSFPDDKLLTLIRDGFFP